MKLYNLKDHNEQVNFAQAIVQGLGKQQGLFFPHDLPEFELTEIDEMLKMDFVSRSSKVLSAFLGDEIPQEVLEERVRAAFGQRVQDCAAAAFEQTKESVGVFFWPTRASSCHHSSIGVPGGNAARIAFSVSGRLF